MTPIDRKDVIDIGDGYYVNYTIEYTSSISKTSDRKDGVIKMYVGISYKEAIMGLSYLSIFTMKDVRIEGWGGLAAALLYETFESAGKEAEMNFRTVVLSKREQLIEIIKQNS